jgi:hypothetical protein
MTMDRGTRRIVAGLIAAGLVAGLPTSSALGGGRGLRRIAHAACDTAPCTIPDNITTPGTGSAIETLPVPAATGAAIEVKPSCAASAAQRTARSACASDPTAPLQLQTVLSGLPSTRARIHKCIDTAIHIVVYKKVDGTPEVIEENSSLAVLFMSMCLEVVRDLRSQPQHATDTAAGCQVMDLDVGVKVTRVGRMYRLQTTGVLKRTHGVPGLRIGCRRLRSGPGTQISVQTTKRGHKLAQALGPTMPIGFQNSSSVSLPLHTTVAFH